MENLLQELIEKNRHLTTQGKVADYIPELAKSNANDVGVCVITNDGTMYKAGEWNKKFTIQSVSKVVTLMLAILDNGEEYVFNKVGMEPSGDPFNSIRKLETSSRRKPYNPMINAGAIAVSSMIKGENVTERFQRLLDFFRKVMENETLEVNAAVYLSESETGHRNRSMAHYMKGDGIIVGNVDEALEIYFKQCSIEVTCEDLARLGLFISNNGVNSKGEQIISPKVARIVKTLMVTCGMYDSSGEYAVRAGIPSKSGVGGGIASAIPGFGGVGTFSPSLDKKGNPLAGIYLMEDLANHLNCSIFK